MTTVPRRYCYTVWHFDFCAQSGFPVMNVVQCGISVLKWLVLFFMTWSPWHNYVDYCTVILFKWLNHYCITILCNHFPLSPYYNGLWHERLNIPIRIHSFFLSSFTMTEQVRIPLGEQTVFLGYFVNTTNTPWLRSHCYESFPVPLQLRCWAGKNVVLAEYLLNEPRLNQFSSSGSVDRQWHL